MGLWLALVELFHYLATVKLKYPYGMISEEMAKNSFASTASKNIGGLVGKSLMITLLLAVIISSTMGSFTPDNQTVPHDNLIIQGTVRNQPHDGFPSTQITARNLLGQIIATANTNSQGQYTLSIISTDINQLSQADINRAFPNPFSDRTNLIFTPRHTGIYTLRVTDLQGRIILTENHQIANHETVNFQISGLGIPGTYIATIQGSQEQATFRITQTVTNHHRSVTVSRNAHTKTLKNTPPSNSLILDYISEGHQPSDTTLNWASHTNVNKTLQVTPDTIITPYNIVVNNNQGLLVNNAQITVKPNQQATPILQGTTNPEGRFQGYIQQIQWKFQENTIKAITQLSTTIAAEQHQTSTRTDQFANPINLSETLTYIPILQYTLNLNLASTNPEKTPLRFRGYILHQTDTLAAQNFTGTQGTLSFQHTEPNINITIGARNIPHFQPNKTTTTITPTTNNNRTINTTPTTYTYDITGEVRHQNNNPAQATITTKGRNTNTNQQGTYTLQDIIRNTDNNNAPLTYNTTITATGNFETQTKNMTVTGQNQTINFTVPNPPPIIRQFRITPFTATNKTMPELTNTPFTLHIRTMSDNQVHSFTQQGNNPIEVTLQGYNDAEQIKMWHNGHYNATMNLSDLMIIEHNALDWRAPNIAQNRITREWTHQTTLDTLRTNIGQLTNPSYNNKLELYMPEYWYETNNGTLNFNSHTVMTMLADRTGYRNVIKNWKGNHVPHIEIMIFDYILDPADPWNNTNKIPQHRLNEMIDISQGIDQYAISATGRIRAPVIYTIVSSREDPAVQAAIARNWDYTNTTWREGGGQPGNTVTLDPTTKRIIRSSSNYPPNSALIDITEELKEQRIAGGNAPNNIPSTNFTYDTNGRLNKLGGTMVAISKAINTGTEILPANR